MASLSLQNIKKVYPNTEPKKKSKKGQPVLKISAAEIYTLMENV